MAWTAIENFDSYSDGDLNGQNGGSGWNAAWVKQLGSATVSVQGTTVYQGAKAVSASDAVLNVFYTRELSSPISTNGIVYWAMRRTHNNTTFANAGIRNGVANGRASVTMNSSGNIILGGTTSTSVLNGYSTNTWYVIRLTFDVSGNTATAAYNSGSGWSSESSSVTMANSGDIDTFFIGSDASVSTDYWDIITGTDPTTPTTSIKTFDGLAYASTKTVDGLAIASVKTWNGLA